MTDQPWRKNPKVKLPLELYHEDVVYFAIKDLKPLIADKQYFESELQERARGFTEEELKDAIQGCNSRIKHALSELNDEQRVEVLLAIGVGVDL